MCDLVLIAELIEAAEAIEKQAEECAQLKPTWLPEDGEEDYECQVCETELPLAALMRRAAKALDIA